jgi:hypothetical protein
MEIDNSTTLVEPKILMFVYYAGFLLAEVMCHRGRVCPSLWESDLMLGNKYWSFVPHYVIGPLAHWIPIGPLRSNSDSSTDHLPFCHSSSKI